MPQLTVQYFNTETQSWSNWMECQFHVNEQGEIQSLEPGIEARVFRVMDGESFFWLCIHEGFLYKVAINQTNYLRAHIWEQPHERIAIERLGELSHLFTVDQSCEHQRPSLFSQDELLELFDRPSLEVYHEQLAGGNHDASLASEWNAQLLENYQRHVLRQLEEHVLPHTEFLPQRQALIEFLRTHFEFTKSSCLSYLAQPQHVVTQAMIRIAEKLANDSQTPALDFLMPGLNQTLQYDFVEYLGVQVQLQELNQIPLDELVQTHLFFEPHFLAPATILLHYLGNVEEHHYLPYTNDDCSSQHRISEKDVLAFFEHSENSRDLKEAYEHFQSFSEEQNHLFHQLNILGRKLKENDAHSGKGTGEDAGSAAYPAIINFFEYYYQLESCALIKSDSEPSISAIPQGCNLAYVVYNNQLYFMNRRNDSIRLIGAAEGLFKPLENRILSQEDLALIETRTRHCYLSGYTHVPEAIRTHIETLHHFSKNNTANAHAGVSTCIGIQGKNIRQSTKACETTLTLIKPSHDAENSRFLEARRALTDKVALLARDCRGADLQYGLGQELIRDLNIIPPRVYDIESLLQITRLFRPQDLKNFILSVEHLQNDIINVLNHTHRLTEFLILASPEACDTILSIELINAICIYPENLNQLIRNINHDSDRFHILIRNIPVSILKTPNVYHSIWPQLSPENQDSLLLRYLEIFQNDAQFTSQFLICPLRYSNINEKFRILISHHFPSVIRNAENLHTYFIYSKGRLLPEIFAQHTHHILSMFQAPKDYLSFLNNPYIFKDLYDAIIAHCEQNPMQIRGTQDIEDAINLIRTVRPEHITILFASMQQGLIDGVEDAIDCVNLLQNLKPLERKLIYRAIYARLFEFIPSSDSFGRDLFLRLYGAMGVTEIQELLSHYPNLIRDFLQKTRNLEEILLSYHLNKEKKQALISEHLEIIIPIIENFKNLEDVLEHLNEEQRAHVLERCQYLQINGLLDLSAMLSLGALDEEIKCKNINMIRDFSCYEPYEIFQVFKTLHCNKETRLSTALFNQLLNVPQGISQLIARPVEIFDLLQFLNPDSIAKCIPILPFAELNQLNANSRMQCLRYLPIETIREFQEKILPSVSSLDSRNILDLITLPDDVFKNIVDILIENIAHNPSADFNFDVIDIIDRPKLSPDKHLALKKLLEALLESQIQKLDIIYNLNEINELIVRIAHKPQLLNEYEYHIIQILLKYGHKKHPNLYRYISTCFEEPVQNTLLGFMQGKWHQVMRGKWRQMVCNNFHPFVFDNINSLLSILIDPQDRIACCQELESQWSSLFGSKPGFGPPLILSYHYLSKILENHEDILVSILSSHRVNMIFAENLFSDLRRILKTYPEKKERLLNVYQNDLKNILCEPDLICDAITHVSQDCVQMVLEHTYLHWKDHAGRLLKMMHEKEMPHQSILLLPHILDDIQELSQLGMLTSQVSPVGGLIRVIQKLAALSSPELSLAFFKALVKKDSSQIHDLYEALKSSVTTYQFNASLFSHPNQEWMTILEELPEPWKTTFFAAIQMSSEADKTCSA